MATGCRSAAPIAANSNAWASWRHRRKTSWRSPDAIECRAALARFQPNLWCLFHDLLVLDEHVRPGPVDQFGGHLIGDTLELADRDHLIDQEDRLIIGVDVVDGRVFHLEQMHQRGLIEWHLLFLGDHGKDL